MPISSKSSSEPPAVGALRGERQTGIVSTLQLVDGWIAAGELARAAERLHEIRLLFPGDEQAITGALKRLRELKCFDFAEDVLASWPEGQPNLWVEWERALLAIARGDNRAGLAAYETICALFPKASLGPAGRIECLLNAQRWSDAEAVIADSTARFPRDIWIWHWAALVAERCREFNLALERWLTICSFTREHAEAEVGVARMLVELGRLDVDDFSHPRQHWGRSALFSEADPGPCPEAIDLTGAPRNLVHGPYAPLSPGVWRAVVGFELCPDAAKRRLSLSFGCSSTQNLSEVELSPIAGRQEVVIEHAVREGDNTSLALSLKRHAFHGEVRFHGAVVERLRDA